MTLRVSAVARSAVRKAMLASVAITLVIGLTGCSSSRAYPGVDSDLLFSAMVSASESPDYWPEALRDRWHVTINTVEVDDDDRSIEVERVLERRRVEPTHDEIYERRAYAIAVWVSRDDPATAKFKLKSGGIPAWAWSEAERFFNDVQRLLDLPPELAPLREGAVPALDADTAPEAAPAAAEPVVDTDAVSEDAVPVIDIDDLSDDQ